ncbi:class I lanthipeptide [Taibaiella koreensis]|uniref:class I lanthipeptide n=1 Tax=Taibaiella koreensis TaxID=1268548 RepID=UPI000E59EA23|nr:class I lanthipeptide [Taibaiella koreensis]
MKKQKIALGKLALNKERITDLNADELNNVIGGSNAATICQVSVQIICLQTVVCVTRTPQCVIVTRPPRCVIGPVTLGGCPINSIACNPTETIGGPSEVIH